MSSDVVSKKQKQVSEPPPMKFQERDGQILHAVYEVGDGMLARRQLKEMFWPDSKSARAMEKRLSLLYHNGYLNRPSRWQLRTKPIAEPIYWLGWKGILWVASQNCHDFEPPKNEKESSMRSFTRRLREVDIRWLREPRWSQLQHDLAVTDFRLSVEKAVGELQRLNLELWVPESRFLTDYDEVEYPVASQNGEIKIKKKGIRPDGYFVIADERRKAMGLPHIARFLLELDNSTHDNNSFGYEKVIPGIVYMKSDAYRVRFGYNSGRWLVVTRGGERRMKNLIRQTRNIGGASSQIFMFSSEGKLGKQKLFTSKVWWNNDDTDPVELFL